MKKYLLLIISVILVLTGCGGSSEFNMDNASKIIEKHLSNLYDISDETLVDVYGLDMKVIEKSIFKQNDDGDFYAIIKTSNTSLTKSDMKGYFEKVEKYNTNYSPERMEIFKKRVEKEIDSYLVYIISSDASSIYDEIIKDM